MADEIDADLHGSASPPRDNGEIVFDAPWQRRVFGLTMALCRADAIEWEAFRQRLIRHIANDEHQPYWDSWAAALEDVLAGASVVTRSELDARHHELVQRAPDH